MTVTARVQSKTDGAKYSQILKEQAYCRPETRIKFTISARQ